MRTFDAWILRRLLVGHTLDGELREVSRPFRALADHLATLPLATRQNAWEAFLTGRDDRDRIILALADVDPTGPPPEAERDAARRTAHLGDLAGANHAGRFTWPRWFVRGHFTLITSEPKVGKTRLGMELAKRLWYGSPWPDCQGPTLPPRTKTLWVPGDRQQDELRELAGAYGLPVEAVLLNASPHEPYGGVSLDDPENIDGLRERVQAEKPGLVFIDTVWRATRRKLSREDEVNMLMDPIIAIAQECDVAIVGMMHASKDGETLGRRLEGLARAVVKLSKPDPEGQPARRKFWVDRANFLEPPPLGVTVHEAGCDFDFTPPAETESARGGRPPEKLAKAITVLTEKLTGGDCKQCDLVDEWISLGEAKGTIFNAMKAMQADGRLIIDDSRKPKICHLVKNLEEGQQPVF